MGRKVFMQWKDPDAPICGFEGFEDHPDQAALKKAERMGDYYHLPDDIQDELRALGMQEYIKIEFDLDEKVGRVVPR
jgi:hypothetical protein